ncbi:MAG: hypothetical protein K2W82_15685 [Candidatus Obscuribacterales bacterium]|nr:hypothetical protein [Candidatus Obscuribacterales bacterium]
MSKSIINQFIPYSANALLAELGERYKALDLVYGPAAEACRQTRQIGSEISNAQKALEQELAKGDQGGKSRAGSYRHTIALKTQEQSVALLTQWAVKAPLYDALFSLLSSMSQVNDWLLSLANTPDQHKNPERQIGIVNLGVCIELCQQVSEVCAKYGTLDGVNFGFLDSLLEQHSGWIKRERPYRFTATIVNQLDNVSQPDLNPPADRAYLFTTWLLRIDSLLDPVQTPYPVGDQVGFAKSIFPPNSKIGDKMLVTVTDWRMEGVRID